MQSAENQVEPVEVAEKDRESTGLSPLVKVSVVFTMLAGALALLWFSTTAEDAFVYSKMVDEVLHDPKAFTGRELRVEGDLKQGSILFKESPCEWRFVLNGSSSTAPALRGGASIEREMPVRFPQCIVPDTFKDGMGLKVTVQGKLTENGYFLANQVIPRCPSKYEMQQKAARGEKTPHGLKMPGMQQPGGA
jgi:cytochrome c-type biogenesis protein CcmE